jgi:paraquat-inducible protein B
MARKASPAMIGGFLLGAIVLAVAALVLLGGGTLFQHRQFWEAYFDESIKGLAIGAPVTFRGVKVGSVTDIKVFVNRDVTPANFRTDVMRTPVFFEISANRISDMGGQEIRLEKDAAGIKRLLEYGLRAQLELQSLVTGQLAINLDFHPGAPMKLAGVSFKYPEFPTIPSTMAALGQSLDDLNVGELAQDIRRTVRGIEQFVNSPEIKQFLVYANKTLERANTLVTNADAEIATLGPALEKTTVALHDTLGTIRALAMNIDRQTVPAVGETLQDVRQLARRIEGETVPAANQLLGDAQQVARRLEAETVPAATQVLTDLRPLLGQTVKTVEAARATLEQAQQTLAISQEAVEEGSPLQFQIRTTLQEVSGAARAIRSLSNYLERHPEAVLFGKEGK